MQTEEVLEDAAAQPSSPPPHSSFDTDMNLDHNPNTDNYIYLRDHTNKKYIVPWEVGKEWSHFKAFVEDVYERRNEKEGGGWGSRMEDLEDLANVRTGRFDVYFANRMKRTDDNVDEGMVLPGVWGEIVRPGVEVRVAFPENRYHVFPEPNATIRQHNERERLKERSRERGEDSDEVGYEAVDVDVGVEDGTSESDGTDEDEEDSEPPPPPEAMRTILPAVDQEGNNLSFTIRSKSAGRESANNSDVLEKSRKFGDMNLESYRILKAVNIEVDGRTMIQIHTLPGPESSAFRSSIGFRWYHVHGEMLDWDQFKTTCTGIPELSDRLKNVIIGTLRKVEKEKRKPFLNGMYIEPGTVLRGDDTDDSNSESVIFSCIPYFEIQKPLSNVSTRSEHLHPARTLMQSYYPYEPVRERDEEQAYRRFKSGQKGSLIHVPTLWMMNIGVHAVVTCGHRPLSTDFVKSIEVLPVDPSQLSTNTTPQSKKLTAIRLTDWDQRVLLYSLDECKTYFEMERKLKELSFQCSRVPANLSLFYKTQNGLKKVTPASWLCVVSQRNTIFIDLSLTNESTASDEATIITPDDVQSMQPALLTKTSVPPFFHWPNITPSNDATDAPASLPDDIKSSIKCLKLTEKAMINKALYKADRIGEVYSQELVNNLKSLLLSRTQKTATYARRSYQTYHQAFVETQRAKIADRAHNLVDIVLDTMKLFVYNLDGSIVLRKVWGAMSNIASIAEQVSEINPCTQDPKEYTDPEWKPEKIGKRSWQIRTPTKTEHSVHPDAEEEFVQSIKHCRRCRHVFTDPNTALEHLRNGHLKNIQGPMSSDPQNAQKLRDWIYNMDQSLRERTIEYTLIMLDRAIDSSRTFRDQLKDLADGVRNNTGDLADIYTFPQKLLETFRRLIIYYLAAEKVFYDLQSNAKIGVEPLSNSNPRTPFVLVEVSEDVKVPLLQAREALCDMARSSTSVDLGKRISLSAEYVCSWLIRRLVVKPLDRSMSIADMYREYLSTLQFQVNHRPGKRLLRSINLLQEELTALSEINDWQTRLITNYTAVLDPATYPTDCPFRRSMYPYERLVLASCLENLALAGEEYIEQIQRCSPLSDSTKQSAEINEEDHGKAILIFTVVTIIFLPLSFVTSYLGMNTSDIRDMENTQSLFWSIAIPLTAVVMGTILFVVYNGDELRDRLSNTYRKLAGKQDQSNNAHGISVAKRKRAAKVFADSSSWSPDHNSLADEAEYMTPRLEWNGGGCVDYTGGGGAQMRPYSPPPLSSPKRGPVVEYATFSSHPPPQKSAVDWGHVPISKPIMRHKTPYTTYVSPQQHVTEHYASYSAPQHRNPFAPTRVPQRRTRASAAYAYPPYASNPYTSPAAVIPHGCIRLHRKQVAPETLAHFALPWEMDPKDGNYVLIKQYLAGEALRELYEHTERLRVEEWRNR